MSDNTIQEENVINDATQQRDSCKYRFFLYQDNSIYLIISRLLRDVNMSYSHCVNPQRWLSNSYHSMALCKTISHRIINSCHSASNCMNFFFVLNSFRCWRNKWSSKGLLRPRIHCSHDMIISYSTSVLRSFIIIIHTGPVSSCE